MGTQHIVVVGAGIVGAASAIWLRRAGLEVTLVDKGAPGMGASYGNACILARSAIVPVTTPGLIPKGPRYLFDPNFPLFMRWSYLPRLLPWLAKYLKNANDADTRRISRGLATVVGDSVEQHKALTDGMPAAKWIQDSEYNFVYRDRAAFEADAYTWALRREAGFVPEIIEGDAVREREPILSPDMRLLAVNKDHGFILNPGSYVQDLVTQFEGMGGRFLQAEVKDFELMGGQITAVATDQGRLVCDKAVLSAGVWSGALMKKLGLEVPLEAERGYHIIFKNPSQRPNNPMMLTEGKFVATPMDQGLRCAGIVEFGGLSDVKSRKPLEMLRRTVARTFPDLDYTTEEEWLGFRPAPTDSLPLIGEVRGSGVYTAFGHHHIGLTGGPKTGRLVADMIAGNWPNADVSAFDPMRFAKT
ncbi:NAD(P)/FAD-dependent oxidoreductase [Tritonibacter scottomollicae]|uniref:D-amino-acid dehydrogenase n=1 Tax=Tritonibacter scottomollicae TaxID=483013 RepID=A0A2T1AGC5_TRISK|nr:FAD-binding oxidoreductase [Tritonibacter scottomollicae]PRZ47649.1 D-amino-acid dehydrogenase [Tritonibacter scottomollicae]